MYVEKLTIQNFRIFENAEATFNYPSPRSATNGSEPSIPRPLANVNLFLGDNGSGKTSICRSLVLGALAPILSVNSGFRPLDLVRIGAPSVNGDQIAEIEADFRIESIDTRDTPLPPDDVTLASLNGFATIVRRGTTEYLARFSEQLWWWNNYYVEEHPGLFVAAYGANRRTERPEAYNETLRGLRYQRVASVFESHVGLLPISQAYSRCLQAGRWNEVVELVNKMLPETVRLLPNTTLPGGEPAFDADGVQLPLASLSDGFRLFIGWLTDLLTHLARIAPQGWKLTDLPGVVIVDEVDLFLHPSWQRTVVRSLSETFPRLQFFFTTHSPIVAATLERHNVYLVERVAPHTAAIRQPTEKFAGRSIDEVLVRLFGLASPRSPELEKQLADLADRAMEGDFDASLEYLRRLRVGVEGE